MNQQQIYDRVKKHLLTQMQQCGNDSSCLYRGADGTKCAIGALIKDKFYSPKLEHKGPREEIVQDALRKSFGLHPKQPIDTDFLGELQEIHDDYSPEDWQNELARFALDYGLKP